MPGVDEAILASRAVVDADASMDACIVVLGPAGVRLAVRSLGRSAAVMETLETARRHTGNHEVLGDSESSSHWQAQVERFAGQADAITIATSTRPRNIADLVANVQRAMFGCRQLEMLVSPGTGSVRLSWPVDTDSARWIEAATDAVTSSGGAYVLECAPVAFRDVVDPWGPEPEGIGIMRAVKQQYDPANVLNRGRLFL
jgi:FAD/FMN-containing dehydrogenase